MQLNFVVLHSVVSFFFCQNRCHVCKWVSLFRKEEQYLKKFQNVFCIPHVVFHIIFFSVAEYRVFLLGALYLIGFSASCTLNLIKASMSKG